MFQGLYMVFIRALQGCFIGVSIKLQECYKSDTWVLQVLLESDKVAKWVFQ